MAQDKYHKNRPSVPGKGNPSDMGQSKAQVKNVNNLDNLDEHEEIKNRYGTEEDNIPGKVMTNNPNRGLDKPDINKPSY